MIEHVFLHGKWSVLQAAVRLSWRVLKCLVSFASTGQSPALSAAASPTASPTASVSLGSGLGVGFAGQVGGRVGQLSCILALLCLFHGPAYGVESGASPKMRYEEALRQIKGSGVLERSEVPADFFASLDWVGKTALINLVCHSSLYRGSLCQSVVNQGLTDEALVIRDHALRTVLADRSLSGAVKETVAQKIVDDDRNYRKGKAFWIVQNAQSYLRLSRKRELGEEQ